MTSMESFHNHPETFFREIVLQFFFDNVMSEKEVINKLITDLSH